MDAMDKDLVQELGSMSPRTGVSRGGFDCGAF
jgi:hypothetical protein